MTADWLTNLVRRRHSAASLLSSIIPSILPSFLPSFLPSIHPSFRPSLPGPMYGKHLTRDQVKTLVNPDGSDSDKAVADVAEWLAGSTNVRTNTGTKVKASYDKDTLTVSIDAVVAEELFETEIRRYSHATLLHTTTIFRTRGRNASATAAAATAPYTVPSSIAEVVAMVGNLAHFPALPIPLQSPHPDNNAAAAAAAAARAAAQHSTQTKNPDWPSDCGKMCAGVLESHVTPAVLQMAYKLGKYSV